ncbi:MAG: type I 3-dehydroquinate dehydratase [Candidatus Methanospirare jalkutatii]|nr:MAG: type I 3-dehydroquinate dehydratase [Candidatus Methanospirare jalkutatii]UYZ40354.1 MAG: type I 3-dehydroquinate dehydratase [Candidatus Methanospirare jalkutatii]
MLRTPALVCVLRELSISKALTALRCGADAVELRLDLFKPEEREATRVKAFVEALREEAKAGVILTNRSASEGGKFEGSEEERLSLLKEALEASEADAVDVEYFAEPRKRAEIVASAKKMNATVIFSFHDFAGMPDAAELEHLALKMHAEGADIAKIAVTPETAEDALKLLELTLKLKASNASKAGKGEAAGEKGVAFIGMGSVGRHLRVLAPIYGSALTYGFLEGEESVAPGQLSISELRSMIDKLSMS